MPTTVLAEAAVPGLLPVSTIRKWQNLINKWSVGMDITLNFHSILITSLHIISSHKNIH